MLRLTLRAYTVCRPTDSRAQLFPFDGGRTWWARFEFTRINIEPIILKNKIEDRRALCAFASMGECPVAVLWVEWLRDAPAV